MNENIDLARPIYWQLPLFSKCPDVFYDEYRVYFLLQVQQLIILYLAVYSNTYKSVID